MSDETPKKAARKGPKIVGTIILVVVLAGGLWFGVSRGIDAILYVQTDDASVDGKQVKLGARMLGRIESIKTEEGAVVAAGDILVTLDDTDLRAQETQTQASLAYARQNLELARINVNKSSDDLSRTRNLYENAAATRESYEHAANAFDIAQAQFNLAQAQVDSATAQLGVIAVQLLNTTLRAPMDGTVDQISLSEGDIVQPSQTILMINDLDDVWITANIEETDIARVKTGASVVVNVDAFGDRAFSGTVEMIHAGIVAPAFQIGEFTKTTQRIPVRIRFDDPVDAENGVDGVRLLPGMSVEIKIRTPTQLPSFVPDAFARR